MSHFELISAFSIKFRLMLMYKSRQCTWATFLLHIYIFTLSHNVIYLYTHSSYHTHNYLIPPCNDLSTHTWEQYERYETTISVVITDVSDSLSLHLFPYLFTLSWRKCVDAVYSACLGSVHPSNIGGRAACPTSIHEVVVSTGNNWYHNAKVLPYWRVQWNVSVLYAFGPKGI